MGVRLYGELKPIPYTERDKPEIVAYWITQHVPCYAGKIPAEYTNEVIRELLKQRISGSVIGAALRLLRSGGKYEFEVTGESARPGYNFQVEPTRPVNETRMGPASKAPMSLAAARFQAERLENAYIKAQSAGDAAGMEAAVVAVLTLLWEFLKGRGEAKGEQDKIDAAAAEVLLNATNMRTIVRQLGPGELARLRQSPTPPNPRNLRFRLPQRPVPARRAR